MNERETYKIIEDKRIELKLKKTSVKNQDGNFIEDSDNYPHIHYDKAFSVFSCKKGDHDQLVQKNKSKAVYEAYIQDIINHCLG